MYHSIKQRKNLLLSFLVIIIITLFLGIGYAQITSVDLNVSGTATADAQTGIVISDITYTTNNNANLSGSKINTYYQTMMNSKIELGNTLDSYITYSIYITNLSNKAKRFDRVIYDSAYYDNEDIVFELNGIDNTTIVDPNDDVTFTITFKYDPNLNAIDEKILNSILNFHFVNKTNAIEEYAPPGVCEFYGQNNDIIGECAEGAHIDYIDTGIQLFNTDNHDNDFEIGFTVDDIDPSRFRSGKVDTIFNCLRDISPYPGITFRIENSKWYLQVGTGTNNKKKSWNPSEIQSFALRKVDNKVYYSINGGDFSFFEDLTTIPVITNSLTIGVAKNSSDSPYPERFLIADLSDIYVRVYEPGELEKPETRTYATVDSEIATFLNKQLTTVYDSSSQHTFDGTDANIINTGVELLNSTNYQKDFVATFTIDEFVTSANAGQATLFNVKDESKSNIWPGLVMRLNSNKNTYELTMKDGLTNSSVNIPLTANRINIIKKDMRMYYQVDLGAILDLGTNNNFSNYPVANTFQIPATFGCNINDVGAYDRKIVGKLSNMKIQMDTN